MLAASELAAGVFTRTSTIRPVSCLRCLRVVITLHRMVSLIQKVDREKRGLSASKSSGDNTHTEDIVDGRKRAKDSFLNHVISEVDWWAEKDPEKKSKAIGKQQASSPSIQMTSGGGGFLVNAATRPVTQAAGESNLVAEGADIIPMK